MKKKILFYSSVEDKQLFQVQTFYQIDIRLLKELGYTIQLSNKIFDTLYFWKYDFVFAYFYRKSFFVALIASLFAKNTYFTGGIDDLDKNYASDKRYRIQKILIRLCYWVSKSCIIVSKSDLENVKNVIRDHSYKKISYSEHSINIDKFAKGFITKEHIFTTIVWMGEEENIRRKGVDTALKIFSYLKQSSTYADYKFVIIGEIGRGTSYIQTLIEKYNISDSVIITGKLPEQDKITYLKKSKYYFQLSHYEGFGMAALEALSAKNIVIHSKKGGLANSVFENGIYFNIDNDFKEELKTLFESLKAFNDQKLDSIYNEIKDYYDHQRRKQDLKNIICE